MNNVTIQKANPEDLPRIQELNALLFREELERDPLLDPAWPFSTEGHAYFQTRIEASGNKRICLTAKAGGQIVGYLEGSVQDPDGTRPIVRAVLEDTLVESAWRGKGIGTALYRTFKEWAKEQGARRIVVHAYSQNGKALEFYAKHGFVELSKALEREV